MTTAVLTENTLRQFLALTKPRVVMLIVFTAVIGMFLASPGLPPVAAVVFGTVGIALVAGAAAAINCLVEQKIDALMARHARKAASRDQRPFDVDANADFRSDRPDRSASSFCTLA